MTKNKRCVGQLEILVRNTRDNSFLWFLRSAYVCLVFFVCLYSAAPMFPMCLLCFSCVSLVLFLCISSVFPNLLIWFRMPHMVSCAFLLFFLNLLVCVSRCFRLLVLCVCVFPMLLLWFCDGFQCVFVCCSYVFHRCGFMF